MAEDSQRRYPTSTTSELLVSSSKLCRTCLRGMDGELDRCFTTKTTRENVEKRKH